MSALSATAVLPLLQTPSIAGESNAGCTRPDLAARFEDLYLRWKERRERDHLESEAFDKAARDGFAFEFSDPELAGWDEINSELYALLEAIMSAPARSWSDVVLQARACALESNQDWTDRDAVAHADAGTLAYRRLVDNIMAMGGGETFPGVTTVPIGTSPKTRS